MTEDQKLRDVKMLRLSAELLANNPDRPGPSPFADHQQMALKLTALADRLEAVLGERAGWVMAPVEPTQAMLDAVCTDEPNGAPFHDPIMRGVYKEMLAAAPSLDRG